MDSLPFGLAIIFLWLSVLSGMVFSDKTTFTFLCLSAICLAIERIRINHIEAMVNKAIETQRREHDRKEN